MEQQVQFLRAAADRKSGEPVIYYRGKDGQIKDFFPLAALRMLRKRRDELIKTERYTRGDRYIVIPPDSMVYASEENTRYFYGEMDAEEERKTKERLLEDIPQEVDRLARIIGCLLQLSLAFESGALTFDGKEFYELLDNDRGYLWMIS
jgi:hypothetical protein